MKQNETEVKKKIVLIGTCKEYSAAGRKINADIFAKITLTNLGNLSISGVIGPRNNGDCYGSCGQFIMSFKKYDKRGHKTLNNINYCYSFDSVMAKRFFDIWDKWHLNDLRPNCQHQTGEAWTAKDVNIYHYRLLDTFCETQKDIKARAEKALLAGESFQASPTEVNILSMPVFITSPMSTAPSGYALDSKVYDWQKEPIEIKSTGWLEESEHPDGFLSKPCPVCGYKYGTAWLREEIPADVLEWLFNLPDAEKSPAWV